MEKQQVIFRFIYSLWLSLILLFSGCVEMSEQETDPAAGLNGGFEVSKNALPVNWLMFTPKTVPKADFEIELDTVVFKEGRQSLKFEVAECTSAGGWHSPGFTNEFFEAGKFEGEARYKLGLWIRNHGAKFSLTGGGVGLKEGDMNLLIESEERLEDWKYFEFQIEVGAENWLRLQLNILQPGTFWIDDVRIEKI